MSIEDVRDDNGIVIGWMYQNNEVVWRYYKEVNADAAELFHNLPDAEQAEKLREEYGLSGADIEAARAWLDKPRAALCYTVNTVVYDYDEETTDYGDDESHVDHGVYAHLGQAMQVATSVEKAMVLVEAKDKVFFTTVACGGALIWESSEHGTSTAGARKALPKTNKGSTDHAK